MNATHLACRWCILAKGLKGSEVDALPTTKEELWDHIEADHKMIVLRPGETPPESRARYYGKFPDRREPEPAEGTGTDG